MVVMEGWLIKKPFSIIVSGGYCAKSITLFCCFIHVLKGKIISIYVDLNKIVKIAYVRQGLT